MNPLDTLLGGNSPEEPFPSRWRWKGSPITAAAAGHQALVD
ncbi:hypothetical protein [Ralstonia solanacearum]|nr:hypothetical protein [Ralstonia solanacearum]